MGSVGSSLPSYDYNNPTHFTDNVSSTKKWFENEKLSNYTEWSDGLTSDQKLAISSFTGTNYKHDFAELYHMNWEDMTPHERKLASDLYDAINKFELKKPIVVYRKADSQLFGMDGMSYADMKQLEGQIVHSNGFMSTAAANNSSGVVSNAVKMEITIPKSVGAGAFVAYHSSVGNFEKEFLLNNNGYYKIDSVEKHGSGKPIVHMRWIGQSKDQIFSKDTNPVIGKTGFAESGKKGTVSEKTVGKNIKKK